MPRLEQPSCRRSVASCVAVPYPELALLVGVLLLATLCAHGLARWRPPDPPAAYAAIDGLRGYLALMVFVHHGAVWWGYLHTGQWRPPPSRLMNNLGEGSVALFFMITALLFGGKLLQARQRPIDWLHLAVSRVLRLTPLYLVAMAAMFMLVALVTGGQLQQPLPQLLVNAARWLLFAIPGAPDLNGLPVTYVLVAGVVWSLMYEWVFYAALPWLALALRLAVPLVGLIVGGLVIAFIAWCASMTQPLQFRYLLPFLGGFGACVLVRWPGFGRLAQHPLATPVVLGLLAVGFLARPSVYSPWPLLALAGAFALLAGGNSVFGLLHSRAARTLGEMSYGLYLLHGLLLFTLMRVAADARAWSADGFALAQLALVPVLVGLCFLAHRLVERPAMRRVRATTRWLRDVRARSAGFSSPRPR